MKDTKVTSHPALHANYTIRQGLLKNKALFCYELLFIRSFFVMLGAEMFVHSARLLFQHSPEGTKENYRRIAQAGIQA
jgi:hypothetical protein